MWAELFLMSFAVDMSGCDSLTTSVTWTSASYQLPALLMRMVKNVLPVTVTRWQHCLTGLKGRQCDYVNCAPESLWSDRLLVPANQLHLELQDTLEKSSSYFNVLTTTH